MSRSSSGCPSALAATDGGSGGGEFGGGRGRGGIADGLAEGGIVGVGIVTAGCIWGRMRHMSLGDIGRGKLFSSGIGSAGWASNVGVGRQWGRWKVELLTWGKVGYRRDM